jgi:hypothetical protein
VRKALSWTADSTREALSVTAEWTIERTGEFGATGTFGERRGYVEFTKTSDQRNLKRIQDVYDSKMDDGGVYVVTLREADVQRSDLTIPRPNRKESLTMAGEKFSRQIRPGERKARGKERERQEARREKG